MDTIMIRPFFRETDGVMLASGYMVQKSGDKKEFSEHNTCPGSSTGCS